MLQISFMDILKLIRKKWITIICFAILGAILFFGYANFFAVKKYKSTASFNISNIIRDEGTGGISATDITASRDLAANFTVILSSNNYLSQIGNNLSKPMSVGQLKSCISYTSSDDATALNVSVTTNNPKLSFEICLKIANTVPEFITKIYKSLNEDCICLYDSPIVASVPSSPNVSKLTAIGFLLGAALSFVVILFIYLFDSSIKTSEDLKRFTGLPNLGNIPSFAKDKTIKK